MIYEIHSGTPASGKCEIRAYDESWELMASYHGYYDWRARAWKLYPLRRYALPQEVAFKKLTLSERDVRYPAPKMKVGADPVSARSEKKAESKQKAWWTQPDPEGQIRISEVNYDNT